MPKELIINHIDKFEPCLFYLIELKADYILIKEMQYYPIWGFSILNTTDISSQWLEWLSQFKPDFMTSETFYKVVYKNAELSGEDGETLLDTEQIRTFISSQLLPKDKKPAYLFIFSDTKKPASPELINAYQTINPDAELVSIFGTLGIPEIAKDLQQRGYYLPWHLAIVVVNDNKTEFSLETKILHTAGELGIVSTSFTLETPRFWTGLRENNFYALLVAQDPHTQEEKILHTAEIPTSTHGIQLQYVFNENKTTPTLLNSHSAVTISDASLQNLLNGPKIHYKAQTAQIVFILDTTIHPDSFEQIRQNLYTIFERLSAPSHHETIQIAIVLYAEYENAPQDASEIIRKNWPKSRLLSFGPAKPGDLIGCLDEVVLLEDRLDYCNALELGIDALNKLSWNADLWRVILIGNTPPHPVDSNEGILCIPYNRFKNGVNWRKAYRQFKERAGNKQLFYSIWVEPIEGGRIPNKKERDYAEAVWKELATGGSINSLSSLDLIINRILKAQNSVRLVTGRFHLPFLNPPDEDDYQTFV